MTNVESVLLFGALLLLVATALVLDLTGVWPRNAAFRWQGSGLLLMFGAQEAITIAEYRGWSGSGALHQWTDPVLAAGVVLLFGGVIVGVRRRRQPGNAHTSDE